MKKEIFIAANWKMNKGIEESVDFFRDFLKIIRSDKAIQGVIPGKIKISIFPQIAALYSMKKEQNDGIISFGVQNIHWKISGAFTGENSAQIALEAGAVFALVGHSERRHLFGEDDETVRNKFNLCKEIGLKPVLCVGETDDEREKGVTSSVLRRQVEKVLHSPNHKDKMMPLMIAYEPVWAIGTGNNATAEDAKQACSEIRDLVGNILDKEAANRAVLLYGGSVNASNAHDLLQQNGIDGLLVGGASLDIEKFLGIIKVAASLFETNQKEEQSM